MVLRSFRYLRHLGPEHKFFIIKFRIPRSKENQSYQMFLIHRPRFMSENISLKKFIDVQFVGSPESENSSHSAIHILQDRKSRNVIQGILSSCFKICVNTSEKDVYLSFIIIIIIFHFNQFTVIFPEN